MKRSKTKKSLQIPPAPVPETAAPHLFLHRCLLAIMAFTAGAAVMIIELAAIRVLAPWFGSSLYTWTGLIGVILTAMSAGYYAGGWLADKKTSYLVLANILALAALFICAIPLCSHLLGTPLASYNVILGPVVASLLMFAVPGFLLGSVSPYIIRLVSLLSADKHIGLSAGTVYMVSTIGSVLGTFASGFWLIPSLDLEKVFWCTGIAVALLAGLGYFLSFRQRGNLAWQSLAAVVAIPVLLLTTAYTRPPEAAGLLFDHMSFYHRIRVKGKNLENGDGVKYLYLDTTLEGAQYDKSSAIPLPYHAIGSSPGYSVRNMMPPSFWEAAPLKCPRPIWIITPGPKSRWWRSTRPWSRSAGASSGSIPIRNCTSWWTTPAGTWPIPG